VTDITSGLTFLRAIPALWALKRYLEQYLQRASEVGGEGLIAELVRLEKEGARLSRDEMVATVFLLLFAGSETTAHLISGSVFELAKNPALRDWLAQDWSRADLAIEEFLRFVSPLQVTQLTFVRGDVDLGGVRLKRGDQVMAMLAAANLDPAANELPERLSRAGRTITWRSAPASISVSAISWRGWKENARSRPCTGGGRNWRLRSSLARSDGAAVPASGRSSACQWRQRPMAADGPRSQARHRHRHPSIWSAIEQPSIWSSGLHGI
jgi:hypothetical protein